MTVFGMPLTIPGRRIEAPGEWERAHIEILVDLGGTFSSIQDLLDVRLERGALAPDGHARMLGALLEWAEHLITFDEPETPMVLVAVYDPEQEENDLAATGA